MIKINVLIIFANEVVDIPTVLSRLPCFPFSLFSLSECRRPLARASTGSITTNKGLMNSLVPL